MKKGITFNDVTLVPIYSEIRSRHDPSVKTKLTDSIFMDIPIISANMSTITEFEMARAMSKIGGVGPIHKFISTTDILNTIAKDSYNGTGAFSFPFVLSLGVKKEDYVKFETLNKYVDVWVVDIAHGDHVLMKEMLQFIKRNNRDAQVIAGNVCTAKGAERLLDWGANAVRVGIGPGSICSTRVATGCGVPQLTAIEEAYKAVGGIIPIIADGGITCSGDIVKALRFGADSVMVGRLLSGANEVPALGKTQYSGMASGQTRTDFNLHNGTAVEGISVEVKPKGPVAKIINELVMGVKSGMSYLNCNTISELRNAEYMEITQNSFEEGKPKF
jgi:IMP dehydrogenase